MGHKTVSKGHNKRPLISISIPVLNEADNIEQLYARLVAVSETMKDRCDLEFVFSDNHSDDDTWSLLRNLAAKDSRVKAIRFSKNFGFQRSILANYLHTKGDAVMQIDADLQDPPEMLEMFFEQWQRGFHVVYGIRKKRQEGWMINQFRKLGYWLIDKISEYPIPRDVGDFRLIDRKIITAISEMKTPSPYIRGMIAGVGFDQCGIPYERNCRVAGSSKFNLIRLIRLGLTAVFNHSTIPLRVSSFLGALILVMTTLGALYYYILYLLESDLPRGFTSTQILILFGIGLNSFFLGIIGEYLLRIYLLLRSERLAIVEQSINFSPSELKL
ncbi:MAG: glycosyltransferase family 2 protein [Alphaproteobacteria bacterium]|nr:glycosyltransferase family 2 protein [Alphaproteobacteria bacterium]MBP9877400.1 glycosyltransferase family 2 protein [Alphaproteobacteria bacterium]